MTTIIYVNNKPFVCLNLSENPNKYYSQMIYYGIIFNMQNYYNDGKYYQMKNIFCKIGDKKVKNYVKKGYTYINKTQFNIDKFDICNNPDYPVTPGKITPV